MCKRREISHHVIHLCGLFLPMSFVIKTLLCESDKIFMVCVDVRELNL